MGRKDIYDFGQNLQDEFNHLGFNLRDSLETAIVTSNGVLITDVIEKHDMLAANEKIIFMVTVTKPQDESGSSIEMINARLVRQTPSQHNYETLAEDDYFQSKQSLPTKGEMITTVVETARLDEIERSLGKEFLQSGFNYEEIKANGIDGVNKEKCELLSIDYLDEPNTLADGLAVIFTITNPKSGIRPVIESMRAALFNDSSYEKCTTLAEKMYLCDNGNLPTKNQILTETQELMKARSVKEGFEKSNSQYQNKNSNNIHL